MGNSTHLFTGSLGGILDLEVTPTMICQDGDLDEMSEEDAPIAARLPARLRDILRTVDSGASDWKATHDRRGFLENFLCNLMDDGKGVIDWVHTFERSQQMQAFSVDVQPSDPVSAIKLKWGPNYRYGKPIVPDEVQKRSGASALSGNNVYTFEMQEMRLALGYILAHPARRAPGFNEELLQYVIGELASAIGGGAKKGHDVVIMAYMG
jgi:hypothetical protein